jgi:hypothetical protein
MADDPWWSCTFAARPTPASGSVPKTPRRKRLEAEDVVRRLVQAVSAIEERCERDLRGGDIHVSVGCVAHAIGPDQLIVQAKRRYWRVEAGMTPTALVSTSVRYKLPSLSMENPPLLGFAA